MRSVSAPDPWLRPKPSAKFLPLIAPRFARSSERRPPTPSVWAAFLTTSGVGYKVQQEGKITYMFVDAVEKAAQFTRAIHTIVRNYGSPVVQPGAATLFFVNADGWALTCKHVAAIFVETDRINKNRVEFQKELAARTGEKKRNQLVRELEGKYGLSKSKRI